MDLAVETDNLHEVYGRVVAVDRISLRVRCGEVFGALKRGDQKPHRAGSDDPGRCRPSPVDCAREGGVPIEYRPRRTDRAGTQGGHGRPPHRGARPATSPSWPGRLTARRASWQAAPVETSALLIALVTGILAAAIGVLANWIKQPEWATVRRVLMILAVLVLGSSMITGFQAATQARDGGGGGSTPPTHDGDTDGPLPPSTAPSRSVPSESPTRTEEPQPSVPPAGAGKSPISTPDDSYRVVYKGKAVTSPLGRCLDEYYIDLNQPAVLKASSSMSGVAGSSGDLVYTECPNGTPTLRVNSTVASIDIGARENTTPWPCIEAMRSSPTAGELYDARANDALCLFTSAGYVVHATVEAVTAAGIKFRVSAWAER